MDVIVGGPFTVTVKLVVPVSPLPSVTVNMMVATPVCPETGVTVTVRAAPVPLSTILAVGTSEMLLEAPTTVNTVTVVKSSPMVKDKADVATPIFTI